MFRICTAVLLLVCVALVMACQKSPEEEARRGLVELGIQYSREAFVQAVENNDKVAVELFLAAGIGTNTIRKDGDNTALMLAATEGQTEFVQALLNAGVTPDLANKNGQTALMWAARRGHTESVRILREAVAEGK